MYWSVSGIPPSFWLDRPSPPEEIDVAVVGGGFVGLSTAYWLAQSGRKPVVLEAEHLAAKASGRNAGCLLTGSAEPFTRLADHLGHHRALAFWGVSRDNRELLRTELLDPGTVEADFLPEGSWIACLRGTEQHAALEESAEVLRTEGFEIEWRGPEAVRAASGSDQTEGALFQPLDGGLDPVRLCRGLAGLGLFEVRGGVRVRGLEQRDDRVHLVTGVGEILARRAVLAVNAYIPSLLPKLSLDVRPVRGQALATEPGERVLSGIWYVNDGYDYLRQLADGTVVLGGRRQVAESQEVGYLESPTGTVQGALEEFLEGTFPRLAGRPVHYRWAGTMAFTADGLPVIGTVDHAPGALYAAGFSGLGMSLGFAVGRHLAERIAAEDEGREVEELFR
jgi:gamma-glutamylputrescine oxidase